MKTVRLALSALIVAGAVYLSPPIFAQGNSNSLPGTQPGSQAIERIQERLEDRDDRRENRVANRCQRLTARIQNRIQNFETNRERHRERYQFLAGRLADAVARLKAKGYDTAALEAHLQEYNGLVGNYAEQYAGFIDALRETANYACGESEGAFAGVLRTAHEKLEIARQTRVQIRNYYRQTIRPEIIALRRQQP